MTDTVLTGTEETTNANTNENQTQTDQTTQTQTTQTQATNWREGIDKQYADTEAIKNLPDINTMAKTLVDSQSELGRRVRMLDENSTEEDKDKFYNRMGRPENADNYKLDDGLEIEDKTRLDGFKIFAHKIGITNNQFNEIVKNELQASNTSYDDAMSNLKTSWGTDYESRVGLANKAVSVFGGEGLIKIMNMNGVGNNPVVIKAFYEAGKLLTKEPAVAAKEGDAVTNNQYDPETAKRMIAEKFRNKEFTKDYFSGQAYGHDDAVKSMSELYQIAYGEKK